MSAPIDTQGKRLALVIGVNSTCSEILPDLNHALNDAEAMAEVLEQKCGFTLFMPPLLAEHASSAKVKKAVLDLTRTRNNDDFLLLYFSGHGQQAYDEIREEIRNTYLGTADFNEQDVEDEPHLHVSMHWLRDRLFEKTNAGRVLIMLDCCFAEDIRTGSDHSFDKLREQIQYYFDIPGAEVKKRQVGCYTSLAAAGYDTPAGEQEGHGKLTRLLLKALHGEEPALLGDKGQITLDRLLSYVKHEMPATQKPVISSSDSTGQECILVSYPDLVPLLRKPSRKLVAERPTTYIPFPHDPLFQERPGEFARLEQLLLPSSTPQLPVRVGLVGVTGTGGIGKTQLAVEFSYRYRERFPSGIFWMPATGHNLFDWQTEFAKLAFNASYLPYDDDSSSAEHEAKRAQHMCRYLSEHADALLILDNVEEPELVVSVLPALAGKDVACATLYTSRITTTPSQVTPYVVESLLEDAALRLLVGTTRQEIWRDIEAGQKSVEAEAARNVCKRVGYLPLALVHLRSRLQQDKRATLVYLDEVLSQGRLTSLKQIIFETFRLSWERIRDEASRRLFLLACYFPEATPVPLWLVGLAAGLGEDARSFEPLGEACLHLQEVSLFEELQVEQVRLHPLVREFGLMVLKEHPQTEHATTVEAIGRLTITFTNLNTLEERTRNAGYYSCLEQVRAVRDYANILQADNTAILERIERWLDRESYLFTDEAGWAKRLPALLYQQLFNHTVEEGKHILTGKAPRQWLEQRNQVGAEDATLIRIFAGHSDLVSSVAFSTDGKYLVTGSWDKTARVWETSSGRLMQSYEGHGGWVNSVAFSTDGKYLVTGSSDGTARVWETSSGRLMHCYEGDRNSVRSVAFSTDGKYLATGSSDNTARVWEIASGRLMQSYQGHIGMVNSVAFSTDGKYLATGSNDQTARVWEINSGRLVQSYQGYGGGVNSVAFSTDGKYLATGSSDSTARVWEIASERLMQSYQGHSNSVRSVAFSTDGKYLATGSSDNTARVWEIASGRLMQSYQGHIGGVHDVAFSTDGKYLATGSSDSTARVWEIASERLMQSYQGHSNSVRSVAFSTDGKYLATGSSDNTARVWEIASGRLMQSYQGHIGGVHGVAFSTDGKYLATGSDDQTARVWEIASGRLMQSYEWHGSWVNSVAFSTDGKYLATGSSDNTARVWEIASGRLMQSYQGHSNSVRSVAFSTDGKYLATGSDDSTARVWEIASGRLMQSYQGHIGIVNSVAFSTDGKYLATGSSDNTARVWEIASGRLMQSYQGHGSWVHSVVFSIDGQYLVTSDGSGYVLIWRAQGPEMGRLMGMYKAVYDVGAVFWQDAADVMLADTGGSTGHSFVYQLRLHGMEE